MRCWDSQGSFPAASLRRTVGHQETVNFRYRMTAFNPPPTFRTQALDGARAAFILRHRIFQIRFGQPDTDAVLPRVEHLSSITEFS
jgi:hypothetical protein